MTGDRRRVVILDMYGVIMKDPTGNLLPYLRKTYPDLREEKVYPHWIRAAAGEISSRAFWEGAVGCADPEEAERAYLDTLEIDPDFYAAALTLRKDFRLALLSNDISRWSRYLRKKHGLDGYFDGIAVSGDAGALKPDPRIFLRLTELLSCGPEDCTVVDDREKNLITAKALGMEVILFGENARGFRTVRNFRELEALLLPDETARKQGG